MLALSPLAEALYLAHKQRSTGSLKVVTDGRVSELLLQDGDLVGAEVRWGYQTSAQSMLRARLIDAEGLDALWAAGPRGEVDAELLLERRGLSVRRALEVQALAHVEKLTERAESIRFDEGLVRPKFEAISSFRVLRAACCGGIAALNGSAVFRCADLSRCEPWLLSDEDREFLRCFESFKHPVGASAANLALLEILRREGAVESVEGPLTQPEAEEMSWADLLEDEPPPAPDQPLTSEADANLAAQSQKELLADMSEALRRSSSSAAQDWVIVDAPMAGQAIIELSPVEAVSDQRISAPSSAETGAAAEEPPLIRVAHSVEPQPSLWQPSPPVLTDVQFFGPIEPTSGESEPAAAALEQPATAANAEAPYPASIDISVEESAWFAEEEDLASDPSDPTRARRQRLLRRAMENLGAPGSRASEPTSAVVVSPEPAEHPSPPDPTGAPHTSDEKALAAAIESRYQEVQAGKDYFTLLGLPQGATAEEAKAAFLEAAKVFHPDRLPPSLQHLSPKITAIFEAVREGYDVLQSDSKRAAYIASLAPAYAAEAPRDTDPKQAAEEAFKRGENLMRKRDYVGAERQFLEACELDRKATYVAAAAWALYMDPNRREEAARAKQMMADALKRDPNCERAHYQLGVIARVEGDTEKSERHFREVVRIAPKHPEANQELRLIQMRKKKEPKRRLFGGKSD